MSTEIILTFAVLGVTIFPFVKEWLHVDVVVVRHAGAALARFDRTKRRAGGAVQQRGVRTIAGCSYNLHRIRVSSHPPSIGAPLL